MVFCSDFINSLFISFLRFILLKMSEKMHKIYGKGVVLSIWMAKICSGGFLEVSL